MNNCFYSLIMRIYIPKKSKSTCMEALCHHFSAVAKNVDLDIVGHQKTRINMQMELVTRDSCLQSGVEVACCLQGGSFSLPTWLQ